MRQPKTDSLKALIYKIDRLNTHNGPGFRTVIYFKGCPLHCTWCHNPEGISTKKEVWSFYTRCVLCENCIPECPEKALSPTPTGIKINRLKCTGCQLCTEVCPSFALEKIGVEYTVDMVFKIICKDKIRFEESGGGITVTGGEPGIFPDFVAELFRQCRENGIHTAFDTSGMVTERALAKIIPYTDIIYLDIKTLDTKKSLYFTGLPVEKLYQTIRWLNTYRSIHITPIIEIHTPLVPQITDNIEELKEIGRFINKTFTKGTNWELGLFNGLFGDKYTKIGGQWPFSGKEYSEADYNQFVGLQSFFKNLNISVTGFIGKFS